jgi:DNA-directed RNA polymerase specialized sigma24 family protein
MNIINCKSRSEWEHLINEWVHSERDRRMLVRYLLDDITLEKIAEEVDISVVQCQKRVALAKKQLLSHV